MSLEYDWMTASEWAEYTGHQTTAAQFAVIGGMTFIAGVAWAVQAMSDFIVETPNGIAFVEGQLGVGLIHGAVLGAFGIVLLSQAPRFWNAAQSTRLSARWRKAQGEAAMTFMATLATVVIKALQMAVEEDGDEDGSSKGGFREANHGRAGR